MKEIKNKDELSSNSMSYWKIFRLVFVILSLYLLGDIFYRWDGFKYYGFFMEFIPSVALIIILWSSVSVVTAFFIWLFIRVARVLPLFIRRIITAEFILIFMCLILVSAMSAFLGKRLLLDGFLSFGFSKRFLPYVVAGIFLLAWIIRGKVDAIQERITPLVWLFGIMVIISLPVVTYSAFVSNSESEVPEGIGQSFETPVKNRPNIIFVIFDAMTARDMSLYGYSRETTPFIDQWAKEATVFTRLQAESNWTPPTVASIMTGKRVWTHQVYQPFSNRIVKGDTESLPLELRKNGYYTMAYVTNHYATVRNLGIESGFDIDYPVSTFQARKSLIDIMESALQDAFIGKIKLYNWFTQKDFIMYKAVKYLMPQLTQAGQSMQMNRVPELAFNKFLEDIDNNLKEPYFAWIHIYPPHDPYIPPEPYIGMFDSSSELRTSTGQDHVKKVHSKYRNKNMRNRLHEILPLMTTLRARYDEDIRYCDKQFEEFILKLREGKKLENTILLLSSDHGESFEHIKVGHGDSYLYEQLTHIPLIIKEPGQTEGRVVNDLVEQVDIAASLLEFAGIPVPAWIEGRSFGPLLRGERLSPVPVMSMNLESNPSRGEEISDGVIAVWQDDYKLIHYLGNRKPHLFDQNTLLFNLKKDPDETINLFEMETGTGRNLLGIIQARLAEANKRIKSVE